MLTKEQLTELLPFSPLSWGDYKQVARAQAEVSFKAGIKEVVEWLDNQYDGSEDMWQSKLEEWGC